MICRNIIIFTAVELESRAVARALAGLDCPLFTIGIRACRIPVEPPAEGAVVILAGLGGALDPALQVGDVVVDDPAGIVPETIALRRGTIHTADQIVATPAEKAALFRQTNALAVDMEGAPVRQLFNPVIHVRAISDTAGEVLDPRTLHLIDEVGHPKPAAIAGALLHDPSLIPYLHRLGKNSKFAAAQLGIAVRAIFESLATA